MHGTLIAYPVNITDMYITETLQAPGIAQHIWEVRRSELSGEIETQIGPGPGLTPASHLSLATTEHITTGIRELQTNKVDIWVVDLDKLDKR